MSLAIKESSVKRVLLQDGWHDVVESTFYLDSYEFLDGDELSHKGGESHICATGFKFSSRREEMVEKKIVVLSGPLSSLYAVELTDIG